ncbi:MAG: orotate phosphoribosyltransferase [Bacillota bacterium]
MISENRIKEIFNKTGVLQEGHFVLSSGRHANKYLQCAQVLKYPEYADELAEGIAQLWEKQNIEVVVGPAMGGIIVSFVVARALGVRGIFTERKQQKMELRRNFSIKPGEKVLLVEDVVTTGGSVREVIDILEKKDADIIGISSLVDRSGGNVNFKYPFKSLIQLNVESYNPEDCPLCKNDIPVSSPGSKKNSR